MANTNMGHKAVSQLEETTVIGDNDLVLVTYNGVSMKMKFSNFISILATKSEIALKADLVNGLIPANQLPSFVDDVLEGLAQNVTQTGAGTYSATGFILTGESSPCTPETGKTYVDTASNVQYRWSGSIFVSMGSNLSLGETATSAYRGDQGAEMYALLSGATGNVQTQLNAKAETAYVNGIRDNVNGDGYDKDNGTYEVGDLCIFNNVLRKCKTAITTPEDFDPTKWDDTTLANELAPLIKNGLANLRIVTM